MASLDGYDLIAGSPTGGAAFLLDGQPFEDVVCNHDPEWTVRIGFGSKYVIARSLKPLRSYQDARDGAFQAVHQALDLLSIKRLGDLNTKDATDEHISWWLDGADSVLRITGTATLKHRYRARFYADGQPPKDDTITIPVTKWHAAIRYFRLSQVTEDLFDAYRNLHLALESLLDAIAPQIPKEGEGVWFKRALVEAGKLFNLALFAPKGAPDPIQAIFDDLYVHTRTRLFHAKSSRPVLLPRKNMSQQSVWESTVRLSRLIQTLVMKVVGTPIGGGGVTLEGFALKMDKIEKRISLHVTDDQAPITDDSTQLTPAGGKAVAMATRRTPELDGDFLRAFIGSATQQEVTALNGITTVWAMGDDKLFAGAKIEADLKCDGFARVEGQFNIRLRSSGWTKRMYSN